MLRSLGFGPFRRSRARFWFPGVTIWADFDIFVRLGGAGNMYNSISMPNYCDEPYSDLVLYVDKVHSAWTKVSIAT